MRIGTLKELILFIRFCIGAFFIGMFVRYIKTNRSMCYREKQSFCKIVIDFVIYIDQVHDKYDENSKLHMFIYDVVQYLIHLFHL